MDICVVTGTYNRLSSLSRMVQSVRNSIPKYSNFKYEIIVVDGGSTDGTIRWCEEQVDIKLIEHRRLLGAIKAFNDGAKSSKADYVIMANDDIEFVGDSIYQSWAFMQDNPDCGIGCFYQNRNGRDWHVEEMPCIEDGAQVMRPYGQVCIIPRWLGDNVK